MTLINNYLTSKRFYYFDINKVKAEHITRNFKTGVEEKAISLWDSIYLIGFGVSIPMATRTPTDEPGKVEIIHKGQRNQLPAHVL